MFCWLKIEPKTNTSPVEAKLSVVQDIGLGRTEGISYDLQPELESCSGCLFTYDTGFVVKFVASGRSASCHLRQHYSIC